MEYEFKVNADLDNQDLQYLFACSFKKNVSLDYFDWKYLRSPEGKVVHATAWSEGKLVAFYGVLPEKLMSEASFLPGYQSMDTMVHPDHFGKGLFIKLAKLCYSNIEDSDKIFAFTGANSTPGFVKYLNFSVVARVHYIYALPWLLSIKSKLCVNAKINLTTETNISEIFEQYLSEREDHNFISRDLRVSKLLWRIFEHPEKKYGLHFIWKEHEMVGFVVVSNNMNNVTTLEYIDFLTLDHVRFLPKVLAKVAKIYKTKYFFAYECSFSRLKLTQHGFFRNRLNRGPFRGGVNFITSHNYLSESTFECSRSDLIIDIQPLMRD